MDDATRDAAHRLATSRIVPLDQALQRELGEIAQDLIDRGLYNSSVQVTNTKSAGERNLVERAELITNTIKEVCSSHNIRSAPTLADDLKSLFDDIYQQQRAAVQRHVEKAVPEQNQEMCLAAVQQDVSALKYVKLQTEDMCLAAVQQDGNALQYVKLQSKKVCLAAVKQDGWAIRFVNDHLQSKETLCFL